jgi:hypothetical protein
LTEIKVEEAIVRVAGEEARPFVGLALIALEMALEEADKNGV